jgi:Tol biopolymer transport system component
VTTQSDRLSTALAGRYRIERELGAGGMATVYLAEDLKHDRKVAIKVLKPELAAVLGAERFVVEIKTTASMSHPHILPLFDSGTVDGFLFYVMPYIQGETIREKLNRETQFGIDDAVRIAREVADALDYAHRHGVIHRDIKPENILLHDGRAMVMDFGIALAVSAAAGGRMTETGLSLGTPHYMSPEQATAEKEITQRSDVYSLASVLYEMLAGEPPHTAGSAQAVIMKIITEPARPVRQVRKNVPANVDAALLKALEKLPADRFESAKAFGDALRDTHFTVSVERSSAQVAAIHSPRLALIGGAILAAAGIVMALWSMKGGPDGGRAPVVMLTLELPGGRPDLGRFAVSQDGARFAFSTDEGFVVRDSARREYRLLSGLGEGDSPAFSPDGAWLAYQNQGHLRKVSLAGGAPVPLIANDSLFGGRVRWGQDNSIVFESGDRIYHLSPTGTLRHLTKVDRGQSPRLTPDGSGVFYTDTRTGSKLMYYDLAADTAFTILEEVAEGTYLPTGHLLYAAVTGGLFAIRFDLKKHTTSGNPIPIVPDIQPNGGIAPFEVTRTGALVYRSGIESEYRVLARNSAGRVDSLPITPRVMSYVRASPDGRQLALTMGSARGTNRHTALYDLGTGNLTRFTQEGGGHSPIWSPDGRRLVFTADIVGGDAEDLFVQPVDKSIAPVRLAAISNDQHASGWPSDSILVFSSSNAPGFLGGSAAVAAGGATAAVNVINPASPAAKHRPLLQAEWAQSDGVVSPDGRWIAYTSAEAGPSEIFVRPFPNVQSGGAVKVSSGGGQRARWSGDGRTIYYQANDANSILAARFTPGTPPSVSAPQTLMRVPLLGSGWDVSWKTGTIYLTQSVGGESARIVVIQNWLDEFRRSEASRK